MKRARSVGGQACLFAILCTVLAGEPARADDSASSSTTNGVLAAVGLQAAGGKATLAGSTGTVEAALLTSGAIDRAGSLISRVVDGAAPTRTILVLAHADVVDLMAARVVRTRIDAFSAAVEAAMTTVCKPSTTTSPASPPSSGRLLEFVPPKTSVTGADIVGALATDVSISPITLSLDDRLIVDAVVAHSLDRGMAPAAANWTVIDEGSTPLIPSHPAAESHYIIPAEMVDVSQSQLLDKYNGLLTAMAPLRLCNNTQASALVSAIDSFSTALNTASTTGPSPLETAMQLEALSAKKDAPPLVLRLAIEQDGGSAITKSNIWYTLGIPGSVQLTAGLLVSFRLVDPAAGEVVAVGFVKCAVPQTNFFDVQGSVAYEDDEGKLHPGRDRAVCAYTTHAVRR